MPKAWLQDRKRDYYYKKAKEEKYRSRAAYKLLQAVKKYRFIKEGDVVLDLGAAPGGWVQAARNSVGSEGYVLGVDLKSVEPFEEENVRTIVGDINDEETLHEILGFLPREADAVVSDASPNISGVWEVDHARQMGLSLRALEIALETLRPSGGFFVKVFQGDMLDDFTKKVKNHFQQVRVVKPEASRGKSSELFILGLNLKKAA
ncbi:MAG: RlmE family RNA methyltransferase [Candidatus Bathyarchaeia archaeon]